MAFHEIRAQTRNPGPTAAPPRHWHALPAEEVVAALASDARTGLPGDESRRRLRERGPNALPEVRRRSRIALLVRQLKSPLIYLLVVAAGIALALGHRSDAVVIFVVLAFNTMIGAVQEGRAERSLDALRRMTKLEARVIRNGQQQVVDARDLVPGDLVLVEAGDAVAADVRLLQAAALRIDEAILTGESLPVAKSPEPVEPRVPLPDRHAMLYAGTHATAGRARGVVVATGLATEIGQIAALAAQAEQPRTPLELRIDQFGRWVAIVALGLFALILAVGWLRGMPFGDVLMVGISQLVGMIPEGLPVAMTIALAVGVQRMARRHAIVRRLAAVETLGSTTVICTDKTGTLTRNEMTATTLVLPDGRELEVSGVGYEPTGVFQENGREFAASALDELRALLEAVVLCNDARLEQGEAEGRWIPIGDPTEVALLALAIKAGLEPAELRRRAPRRAEIPFDPGSKWMATQHDTQAGPRIFIKGAPEAVAPLCQAASDIAHAAWLAAADRMASRALRVLAVAVVEDVADDFQLAPAGAVGLQGRARLLGFVGEIDPPRPEVEQAVARCREAGIRPVMVTGDHKQTGLAIARTLGIARDGDDALAGRELEDLSDEELSARLDRVSVFARVEPAQKLRIVDAYQRRGEVVAMTGDGVNDAPALVQADVGVAMGGAGTEVAKQASRIVLADDNFASIVSAVEEGRVVYLNIKKALLLLFSTSAAEVAVLLLAMLLGYPAPFAAVQILWNNLVTEGVITVNLVLEPPEGDEMRRPPISPREPLMTRLLLTRAAFMVPAITLSTLGWFILRTNAGVSSAQVQTETFTLLAICEWFNVLNCRSETRSALNFDVLTNPWLAGGLLLGNLLQVAVVFWEPLGRVMHTVPFSLKEVVALALVGSLVLWVEEARKWVVRSRRP